MSRTTDAFMLTGGAILVLFYVTFIVAVFGLSLTGVVVAFSTSVVIGFLFLFIPPAYFVTGFAHYFLGVNLVEKLAQALGLL